MNEQYKQKLPDYIDPRRTRAIFVICIKQHVVPSRELTHPTWEKENHRLSKKCQLVVDIYLLVSKEGVGVEFDMKLFCIADSVVV